ncbi:hypothetical protein WDU94_012809 [Cyamophila willieti]
MKGTVTQNAIFMRYNANTSNKFCEHSNILRTEFSRFLIRSGIRPKLTRVLHALYQELHKPPVRKPFADSAYPELDPNKPIVFIQNKLEDKRPRMEELDKILEELNSVREEIEARRAEVADLEDKLRVRSGGESEDLDCVDSLHTDGIEYEEFL